jgi:hypothetical protein
VKREGKMLKDKKPSYIDGPEKPKKIPVCAGMTNRAGPFLHDVHLILKILNAFLGGK